MASVLNHRFLTEYTELGSLICLLFNYLLHVGASAEILELQVTWLLDVLGSTGKSEESA